MISSSSLSSYLTHLLLLSCLSTSLHAILQTCQMCYCLSTIPLTIPSSWNILVLCIRLVNSLTSSKVPAQELPWTKVSKLYHVCSVFGTLKLYCFFFFRKYLNPLKIFLMHYLSSKLLSLSTPRGQSPLSVLLNSVAQAQNLQHSGTQQTLN